MPEKRIGALALRLLGLVACILPPTVCTLSYFPLWVERGSGTTVSGMALVLLMICAVPLFRYFRKAIGTPSSPIVWLAIFLLFLFLSKIAEQITVISLVGFIGNLIGSVLFRLAKRVRGDTGAA